LKLYKIILVISALVLLAAPSFAQPGKIQLLWPSAQDAVMYELEIAEIAIRSNKQAPQENVVYTTPYIYTPGTEISLSELGERDISKLYYRVRPLDLEQNPIGPFTEPVALEKSEINPTKPATTAYHNRQPALLYPVYSWIPVLGAERYEIEVTNKSPENPNGTEPSQFRVRVYSMGRGFDYYDLEAFREAGTYYWRVIAFNDEGQPIGTYSDAVMFKVHTGGYHWAAFGDSITHGGGAISNPPSDRRFDYSAYLPFPVKNLGRSGDTSAMLADRFDSDVLPFKPQYLLILGGSNSIRGGAKGEEVIADLITIKQKCEANDIIPIFLTLPPVNPERIERVFDQSTADNWQLELAKVNAFLRTQPYVVDIYSALVDEKGILPVKYAQDGLHPDISGKKVIAGQIMGFLAKTRLP
jgi:lysophospholipase L1-like esterase